MKRRLLFALALFALASALPATVRGDVVVAPGGGTPGTSANFRLVGHEPLFNRGMNAALAVFDDKGFVYVGNRTDGQPRHPRPGILVVDARDPSDPRVVNEIGPPHAGNVGETTRELRIWRKEKLLIVLSFRCSPVIHDCAGNQVQPTFRFFDLSDPANPEHLMTYVPVQVEEEPGGGQHHEPRVPHEFFLWVDPKDDDRALLWASTPTTSCDPARANLVIYDISDVRDGVEPSPVAQGNWNSRYPGGCSPANYDFDLILHSMGVTADGKLTHLAQQRGHYLALDTTEVVENARPGTVLDLNDNLITDPVDRPRWGTSDGGCPKNCAESHSSVQVPGRALELNTDEVYGTFTAPSHGCPWGWVRLIDTSDLRHPRIVGEYKLAKNTCPADDPATEAFSSYASHNPTVTKHLALVTWHSGGFQAIDIARASRPRQAGWFSPTPLAAVATEDPALGRGPNKVIMWSYPVIDDGLIYVVDLRNGLYVLRYTGRHRGQVRSLDFYEGNSNLGDAVRLAKRGEEDDD